MDGKMAETPQQKYYTDNTRVNLDRKELREHIDELNRSGLTEAARILVQKLTRD